MAPCSMTFPQFRISGNEIFVAQWWVEGLSLSSVSYTGRQFRLTVFDASRFNETEFKMTKWRFSYLTQMDGFVRLQVKTLVSIEPLFFPTRGRWIVLMTICLQRLWVVCENSEVLAHLRFPKIDKEVEAVFNSKYRSFGWKYLQK